MKAILILIPALAYGWQAPSFEVADIRPSDPSVMKTGKGRMLPGGRIELPGQTVRDLIAFAYGVQDEMIVGAPKWVGEERFDIVAKAPSTAAPDTLRQMLRNLLADRFRLATHSEDKRTSAYVLSSTSGASGIRESGGGQGVCSWADSNKGFRRRECRNITMEEFAKQLPNTGGIGIDLPVKDETGLKGKYDFEFEVGIAPKRNPESADGAAPSLDDSGPSIFLALSKLGLRLDEKKVLIPAIAVDRVQRPVQ